MQNPEWVSRKDPMPMRSQRLSAVQVVRFSPFVRRAQKLALVTMGMIFGVVKEARCMSSWVTISSLHVQQ